MLWLRFGGLWFGFADCSVVCVSCCFWVQFYCWCCFGFVAAGGFRLTHVCGVLVCFVVVVDLHGDACLVYFVF